MTYITWEEAVRWLINQDGQEFLVKACYFDDPILDAAERFYKSPEWIESAKLLPKHRGKVLDIGAGRGISSFALAKDGWQVTALEPNQSDLVGAGAINNLANQSKLNIDIVTDFGEKLPFKSATFDFVNCRQSLHHATNLGQMLKEINRVLKPGGRLLATREHVISKKEDLNIFLDSHPLHRYYGGENAYLLQEYKDAITSSGLKIKKLIAPLESAINYFPMTENQRVDYCRPFISKYFGSRLTKSLLPHNSKFSQRLINILMPIVNNADHQPGRLYSFVAIKPK